MTPTHKLKLADGYGSTECELIKADGPLASVRVRCNSYFEADRFTVRVVRTSCMTPIN